MVRPSMLASISYFISDRHLPTEYPLKTALRFYWLRLVVTGVVTISATFIAVIVAIFMVDATLAIIIVIAGVIVGALVISEMGEIDPVDDQILYPTTNTEIERSQEEEAQKLEPQNNQHSLPPKRPFESIKWPQSKKKDFDRKG